MSHYINYPTEFFICPISIIEGLKIALRSINSLIKGNVTNTGQSLIVTLTKLLFPSPFTWMSYVWLKR